MNSKPWLSPQQQIEHLKRKGVSFKLMSESDALDYLEHNNNYFRLRSYRSGLDKVIGSPNDGHYIGLDFAMLRDLSVIDYELRQAMLPITIDVEHYSKVSLLEYLGANGIDPYDVVAKYLSSKDSYDARGDVFNWVRQDIVRGKRGCYTNDLIEAYEKSGYPIWEFVELIPFGTFVDFWSWVSASQVDKELKRRSYELHAVKGLRNTCAHNNCIINNLKAGKPRHQVSYEVRNAVNDLRIKGVNTKAKLSNERLQHMATALYSHSCIASAEVRAHKGAQLHELAERMYRNEGYYERNDQIRTGFAFIRGLVEGWFVE